MFANADLIYLFWGESARLDSKPSDDVFVDDKSLTASLPSTREEVDWAPYLPQLRKLEKGRPFVATDSVRTLYYLDDWWVVASCRWL